MAVQPACLLVFLPVCPHADLLALVVVLSRHLLDPCLRLVAPFRHLLVDAARLAALVVELVARVVSVLALAVVLALVVLVPVVLVDLADSAQALVALVLAVPAAHVPAALAVLVLVEHLVLVAVLAPVAVLVDLVLAVLVVVLAPVAVLEVVRVDRATVSVARLVKSHVHVVGASSMNCSRSSRVTPIAMHQYPKAPLSSNVVGLLKSLLQS